MPLAPTHTIILSAPCYQGNIRQVTDADGKVEQDNHYYPYGMLMAESSDILAAALGTGNKDANPYLFGSKEYLTTAGTNLLDFTARTYDPSTLLFHTQDPNSGDYTSFNAYLYCGANPVNRIDPTGCSTDAILESDGRYRITGGNLDDKDLNIYLVVEKDGKYERTGEIIGVTPVITSFYNSDNNIWTGYIDTNDKSGINFISKMTGNNIPGLVEYALDARGGYPYDFKVTNGTSKKITDIDIYRGMPIGTDSNGTRIYTSARDIGNMIAGYVCGAYGLDWPEVRSYFDVYQSIQSISENGSITFAAEGISSQNAQYYGLNWGKKDTSYFKREMRRAIHLSIIHISYSLIKYFSTK